MTAAESIAGGTTVIVDETGPVGLNGTDSANATGFPNVRANKLDNPLLSLFHPGNVRKVSAPNNQDIDLKWQRFSGASYIDKYGTVRYSPSYLTTNQHIYSQAFDNAAWTETDCTVSGDLSTIQPAPDGSMTADWVAADATATILPNVSDGLSSAQVVGDYYTVSIFAKKGQCNVLQICFESSDVDFNPRANFDLQNGVLGTVSDECIAHIELVDYNWYRCSMTVISAVTALVPIYLLMKLPTDTRAQTNAWTSGDGLSLWGAQAEAGRSANGYLATEGLELSSDSNSFIKQPREESDGWLIEGPSTNLCTYSSDFSTGYTASPNTNMLEFNQTTAPDGMPNASKLQSDIAGTGSTFHQMFGPNLTIGADNAAATLSCFVKSAGWQYARLRTRTKANNKLDQVFDLDNGTLSTASPGVSGAITAVGNGWYHCQMTVADMETGATTPNTWFYTSNSSAIASVTGDGTSGCYIWGMQFEHHPFATSYIPTVSASVSRTADIIEVASDNNIYEVIGSIVLQAKLLGVDGNDQVVVEARSGTANTYFHLERKESISDIRATISIAGSTQAQLDDTVNWDAGDTKQIVLNYEVDDFSLYTDGVSRATDSSGDIPTGITTIYIGDDYNGSNQFWGHLKNMRIYDFPLNTDEITFEAE